MNKTYLFLSLLVLVIAAAFFFFPSVQQKEQNQAEALLKEIHSSNRYLTTDEVAKRIIDGDPTLYLVDVRFKEDFETYSLPDAVNVPLVNILDEEWEEKLNQDVLDIVFLSNDGIDAEQAWALCRRQGYSNLYVLKGGLNEWFATIMLPKEPGELASTEELELYSFRTGASIYFGSGTVEVPVIVEVEAKKEPEPVVKKSITVEKKVKVEDEGGC